jgi:hypothetical protein
VEHGHNVKGEVEVLGKVNSNVLATDRK